MLVALGAVAAVLLVLSHKWTLGMLPASLLLLMLVGLGACIGPVSTRGAQLALLAGGAVLVLLSVRWATGHFATTLYVSLVALLAAFAPAASRPEVAKLVLAGTALALVVSFTSSNGIHSFGIGAAGVIPFLVLHLAGGLASSTRPVGPGVIRWLLPPAVTALIVINGALNPYREQRLGNPFERIRDVPAFAGLWTSPARNQTIETFRQFLAANSPENQRLLVVGPHPWLYFVARARPATPMLFMHFSVREENYDLVAKHLFRAGPPDVIVLANSVPRALHARVSEWMAQGAIVQKATLPEDFVQRYFQQTRQEIGREVLVLRRPPPRQP